MLDLAEPFRRRGSDALRRRVGGDELGMLVLDRLQLVVQRVVGGIRELRVVEDVVAVEVVLDEAPQLLGPLGRRVAFDFVLDDIEQVLRRVDERIRLLRQQAFRRSGSRPSRPRRRMRPPPFAAWMSNGESPT